MSEQDVDNQVPQPDPTEGEAASPDEEQKTKQLIEDAKTKIYKSAISAKDATKSIFSKLQDKFGKRKAIAIIVSTAAVAILLAFSSCGSLLNPDKRYAVDIASDYQSILKDPESMSIRSDVTIVRITPEEGSEWVCCYFEASATNGFGGSTTSIPIYVDGEYQIDADGDYADGSNDEILANMDKISLQLQWRTWQLDGFPENSEVSTVDGKSVADALGVSFYG